jgi:hypothetical protein
MFNLLVSGSGWQPHRDKMSLSRVVNGYTDDDILATYAPSGVPQFELLRELPALFAEETQSAPTTPQYARVGRIVDLQRRGSDVQIEYVLDQNVPPIPQATLISMATPLGIDMSGRGWTELGTTHWAVKRADLYKEVLATAVASARVPTVFQLPAIQSIDATQVAAMMPFASAFESVYSAIAGAASDNGMQCNRADDVWLHRAIIQDIVSLIDRSAILVCDCSGRNPNVFYEIGIADALGKEVILITQHADDVPFDLRHLRYIQYLNNGEGCQRLREDLRRRMADLSARSR